MWPASSTCRRRRASAGPAGMLVGCARHRRGMCEGVGPVARRASSGQTTSSGHRRRSARSGRRDLAAPGRHAVRPALGDRVVDLRRAGRRRATASSISAGPMPPPPLKWQPAQLYLPKSRLPSGDVPRRCRHRARRADRAAAAGRPGRGCRDWRAAALAAAAGHGAGAGLCVWQPASGERQRRRQRPAQQCGQREDIEHASRGGASASGRPWRRRSRAAAVASRGSRSPETIAPAQPPTPESTATYCLPSGPAIGDRLADDPGAGLELPQQLAGARVDRLEPAVHRAVEDDVAGGRERAAPDREILLDLPARLARRPGPRR